MNFKIASLLLVFLIGHTKLIAQNVDKDIALGQDGLVEVTAQMGIYKDAVLESLLQKIGGKLVAQLEKPLFEYQFYIVDTKEPNAFALPGGKIFITRGLLMLPLSEDELAGIIGHEIIHSNNRHGIKQQKGTIWGNIISVPGVLISGIVHGPVGQIAASPFLIGDMLIDANYSRKHESEADKQGVMLAAKAGYNPVALADILARLSAEVELLSGNTETKSYFDSHPYTPKRVKKINDISQNLVPSKQAHLLNNKEFLASFNNLLLGNNPKYGFVENNTFYCPIHLYKIPVPEKWITQYTPTTLAMASPDGDAVLSLNIEKDTMGYGSFLNEFESKMLDETGRKPIRKEKISWKGFKGGMLRYEIVNQTDKAILEISSFNYINNSVLKMAVLYKIQSENEVKSILKEAKPIDVSTIPNTTVLQLIIVEAKENETLGQIINNYNASQKAEIISLINNSKLIKTYIGGELVKIISTQKITF